MPITKVLFQQHSSPAFVNSLINDTSPRYRYDNASERRSNIARKQALGRPAEHAINHTWPASADRHPKFLAPTSTKPAAVLRAQRSLSDDATLLPALQASNAAALISDELAPDALAGLALEQAVFALSYQQIFNTSIEQALRVIPELDAALYARFRNANSAAQIDAVWHQQSPQNQQIAVLAGGLMHWLKDKPWQPEHYAKAVRVAILQYQGILQSRLDNHGVSVYWQVLQRACDQIDPQKISHNGYVNLNILKAVASQRRMPVPLLPSLNDELGQNFDVLLDEAALIATQLNDHTSSQELQQPLPSHFNLQVTYRLALLDDLQDAMIGQRLIPRSPVQPDYARFWYHQGTLQNAAGMNLKNIGDALFEQSSRPEGSAMAQLIARTPGSLPLSPDTDFIGLRNHAMAMLAQPSIARYQRRADTVPYDTAWLTRTELARIVEKMFHELALDPHFMIGSPFHSLASTAIRLGPAHRFHFRNLIDPVQLVEDFSRLDQAWSQDSQFPFKPSLTAAFHLALSNAIPLIGKHDDADTVMQQCITLPFEREPYLPIWMRRQQQQLPMPAQEEHPLILRRMEKCYQTYRITPETITYNSESDLLHQLTTLLSNSLRAYAPLPIYDEDREIRQRLKNDLALTDAQLNQARYVYLYLRTYPFRTKALVLETPLAEFKIRNRHALFDMTFNGRSINTKKTMASIKPVLKARLMLDPVVLARVRELLRLRGSPYTQTDFDQLLQAQVSALIVPDPVAPTNQALQIASKFIIGPSVMNDVITRFSSGEPRKILELLPFIMPLYDIEEGLRHGNSSQALHGAINFGIDALTCWIGGLAEGAMRAQLTRNIATIEEAALRMPAHEAANIATLTALGDKLPHLLDAELSVQRKILRNSDPFSLSRKTVENSPQKLLYLKQEKRVVPVQKQENYWAECNLYGEPQLDAMPIFEVDSASRAQQTTRRLPGGSAAISVEQLKQRNTVSNVLRYWEKVKRNPIIARRVDKPLIAFNKLFKFNNPKHSMVKDFELFIKSRYERSPTMAAILNHAQQNPGSKRISIFFDQERARATENEIHFLNDQALGKAHYMSPTGAHGFSREHMWLHELLHKLTGLHDVPPEISHFNRGSIIYFVDRIEDEARLGLIQPARISYNKAYFQPNARNPAGMVPEQIRHIGQAHDWSIAENIYLDQNLDPITRHSDHSYTLSPHTPRRSTVQETLALRRDLKTQSGNATPIEPIIDMLLSDIAPDSGPAIALRHHINDIAEKSIWFRRAYSFWKKNSQSAPIKIKFAPLKRIDNHIYPHQISYGRKKATIVINTDPVFYYSDHGAELMSDERKLTGALLDLILPKMPSSRPLHMNKLSFDRGPVVLMENQMMQLAGDRSPRRICAAVTDRANGFLQYQTSVIRQADSEDFFLRTQSAR